MLRRFFVSIISARCLAAVLGLAVTLMMILGIHLHQAVPQQAHPAHDQCADHHASHASQHLASIFTAEHAAPRTGEGNDVPDPDGCGSCHCQMPNTTTAVLSSLPEFTDSGYADVVCSMFDVIIPDSLSFKPDPPPIRG